MVGASLCDLVADWCNIDTKILRKGAILAWCVWHERNQLVFKSKEVPNSVIIDRVERLDEEQGKYVKCIYSKPGLTKAPRQQKVWAAPPPGYVKINSDASLNTEGVVGLGVVARNEDGDVIFAAVRRSRAWWQPMIAEAKSIVMALRLGIRYGLQDVVVESDCEAIVSRLGRSMVYCTELDAILEDILALSCSFNSISFVHVKRDGNMVAHHLARSFPFGDEQIWVSHSPPGYCTLCIDG